MFLIMSKEPYMIGYARVSTDDQDLALQVEALKRYGVPDDQIVKEHASGGTMNRPQWNRVMKAIRPGDVVVVWKLDRLGRTLKGVLETVETMEKKGVQIASITEKIDTTTAMGRAFFHIITVFAELERAMISERTKAGMAARRAAGVRLGAPGKIEGSEKRLAFYREIVESGEIDTLTDQQVIDGMNARDPVKPIRSVNTLKKWLKEGCKGL